MASKKQFGTYSEYGFGTVTMKRGDGSNYKHKAGKFWFKTKKEADLHRQMKKVGVKITDIRTGKTVRSK